MINLKPRIDVSIVTYNSEKWIESFFQSLLEQEYPLSLISVYITDHQSTDKTLLVWQKIEELYADRFELLQIESRENRGFGAGHNNNIKKSKADYILVTNVDLKLEKSSISKVIKNAERDFADVGSWEFRQKPYEHPKYYNPVTLETNWSSHACVLLRRKAIESVGGYEEKIFLYGEDVELSYRLRAKGFKLKYCPKSVCWHYTYEQPSEIKPLQFSGSTLANSYIRLRYGSIKNILAIPLRYLRLLLSKSVVKRQKWDLLKNLLKILVNAPYFLSTRQNSNNAKVEFGIRGWDYEMIRDGAFYAYDSSFPSNPPLVSIIIRTYQGRLGYLKESITSVLNQTYSNLELIVVEDGSETSRQYVEELQGKSPRTIQISYFSVPKRGRCYAGNFGLEQATGVFIGFLDDDDLFFADHVEVLVEQLLANSNISASYSLAWEVKTKVVSIEPLIYKELSHETLYRQPFSRVLIWHHNYIPIQAILFKRSLYDKYGGFDESLENLEDWNLWTRYSLYDDFNLVEKTTSVYRVPAEEDKQQKRQKMLDSYYQSAIEKQKDLFVNLNPLQVMEFHKELHRYEHIGFVSKTDLKGVIDKFSSKLRRLKNLFRL